MAKCIIDRFKVVNIKNCYYNPLLFFFRYPLLGILCDCLFIIYTCKRIILEFIHYLHSSAGMSDRLIWYNSSDYNFIAAALIMYSSNESDSFKYITLRSYCTIHLYRKTVSICFHIKHKCIEHSFLIIFYITLWKHFSLPLVYIHIIKNNSVKSVILEHLKHISRFVIYKCKFISETHKKPYSWKAVHCGFIITNRFIYINYLNTYIASVLNHTFFCMDSHNIVMPPIIFLFQTENFFAPRKRLIFNKLLKWFNIIRMNIIRNLKASQFFTPKITCKAFVRDKNIIFIIKWCQSSFKPAALMIFDTNVKISTLIISHDNIPFLIVKFRRCAAVIPHNYNFYYMILVLSLQVYLFNLNKFYKIWHDFLGIFTHKYINFCNLGLWYQYTILYLFFNCPML